MGIESGAATSTNRFAATGSNPTGSGSSVDCNRAAEGMADDRFERPEPLAGKGCRLDGLGHVERAAKRATMARQVERDHAHAGIPVAFDQRLHVFGTRAPAVDDEHGPPACSLRAKLVHRHAALLRLDSMMTRLGHEARRVADGALFT
ncbi:hypothetical protein SLT36_14485 [Aminobacter sp. BA135]